MEGLGAGPTEPAAADATAEDRRNVEDRYRGWSVEDVAADLAARAHPFHVAIENLAHDFNIGSIVRTANAFDARAVHVVGRRRWNRRGAMVTDRYLDVRHHEDAATFHAWARAEGLPVVGVDNVAGASAVETVELPRECVLLFGAEGPGLSAEAVAGCAAVVGISQFGSTRSINVGAAAAVVMHAWVRRWVFGQRVHPVAGGEPAQGEPTTKTPSTISPSTDVGCSDHDTPPSVVRSPGSSADPVSSGMDSPPHWGGIDSRSAWHRRGCDPSSTT